MAANISHDVVFRATIKDDTKIGAESAKKKYIQELAQRDIERAERVERTKDDLRRAMFERQRKQETETIKGHGEGGFGRILTDARTTGLDTLSRGLLEHLGDKLGGAMKIGAAAVIGATFDHLTSQTADFADGIRRGGVAADEAKVKLGESIPIIGSFVSGYKNAWEMITGEKVELERIKEYTADIIEMNDRNYETSLHMLDAEKQRAETLRQMRDQERAITLRGSTLERHNIESRNRATIANDQISLEKAIKGRSDDPIAKEARDALVAEEAVKNKWNAVNGDRLAELQAWDEVFKKANGASYTKNTELMNLETYQQGIFAAVDQATKKSAKAQKDALKFAQDKLALDQKRQKDEPLEFSKRNNERLKLAADSAGAEHDQAAAMAAAERAAVGGRAHDSAMAVIAARVESEKAQARIAAEGLSNATADAAEKKNIESRLATKLADIDATAATDRAVANKRYGAERVHIQYDTNQAVAAAVAAGDAERLRETGEGYKAQQMLDQRAHDKRLSDIDERAKEQITQNSDNAKAILATARAEKTKENADFKEQQRQAGRDQVHGQYQISKDLIAGQVDALNAEARMGNIAASAEAKRLEIHEQFADKRAHLQDILHDTHATKAQKDIAQKQFDALGGQENDAEKMAFFTGGINIPTMNIQARTTGAAERAKEEGSAAVRLSKLTEQGNKDIARTAKATEAIIAILKKNPELAPLLKGF